MSHGTLDCRHCSSQCPALESSEQSSSPGWIRKDPAWVVPKGGLRSDRDLGAVISACVWVLRIVDTCSYRRVRQTPLDNKSREELPSPSKVSWVPADSRELTHCSFRRPTSSREDPDTSRGSSVVRGVGLILLILFCRRLYPKLMLGIDEDVACCWGPDRHSVSPLLRRQPALLTSCVARPLRGLPVY